MHGRIGEGAAVLDIGCGEGYVAAAMAVAAVAVAVLVVDVAAVRRQLLEPCSHPMQCASRPSLLFLTTMR